MRNQLLGVALTFTCVLCSCSGKEKGPDITTGLVVHIPLDGTAVDVISNTAGIVFKAVPAADRNGEPDKAMYFPPGDSAEIDLGDLEAASFTNNIFTVSCWVQTVDTLEVRAVLSKRAAGGPFEYSLDNHFNRNAYTLDNWVSSGAGTVYGVDPLNAAATVALGAWQHIAYVADGSTLKVYVDGVLQSGTDVRQAGKDFGNTSAPLMIGVGGAFGVNHHFSGSIDEVRMYNRALNTEEIQALKDL